MSGERLVRGLFWAAKVAGATPPFDTIHLKVTYPARAEGTEAERLSGTFPVDPAAGKLPVVVFAPGVNVSPDAYGWLARRLAARGYAVVTYAWVAELFGGEYGITPGIDLGAVTPDTYGSRAPLSALAPLVAAVAELDAGAGPLAGHLDLDRIVLGGHSAGGTVALQSARHGYCPALRAVFTYGAHTMASTMLGWPAGTVLPPGGDVPLLLAGGSDDGVIAGSAVRYGEDGGDREDPLSRTFAAVPRDAGDVYLAVLDGANHFAAVDPHDPTTARGFLDVEPRTPVALSRERFAGLVDDFLDAHVRDDADARGRLDALVADRPADLAVFERR